MKLTFGLLLSLFAISPVAQAQLSINSVGTPYVINFDSTVSGVSNGAYMAFGFQPNPTAGQLDSDAWEVKGWNDFPTLNFGDTRTDLNTDLAQGHTTESVSAGGMYSIDLGTGSGNMLVLQAGNSDFDPGTLTLRIVNNSGAAVTGFAVSYTRFVRNDKDRSDNFNWSWDTNSAGTFANSLNAYQSPATLSPDAILTATVNATINTTLANGASIYLRWKEVTASGTGQHDEFGIDDITITAVPEPSGTLMASVASLLLLSLRRRGRKVS